MLLIQSTVIGEEKMRMRNAPTFQENLAKEDWRLPERRSLGLTLLAAKALKATYISSSMTTTFCIIWTLRRALNSNLFPSKSTILFLIFTNQFQSQQDNCFWLEEHRLMQLKGNHLTFTNLISRTTVLIWSTSWSSVDHRTQFVSTTDTYTFWEDISTTRCWQIAVKDTT